MMLVWVTYIAQTAIYSTTQVAPLESSWVRSEIVVLITTFLQFLNMYVMVMPVQFSFFYPALEPGLRKHVAFSHVPHQHMVAFPCNPVLRPRQQT